MAEDQILTLNSRNALELQENNAKTIEIDLTTLDTTVEASYDNERGIGVINRETGNIDAIISDENGIVTIDVTNLPVGTEFTTITLSNAARLNSDNPLLAGEKITGTSGPDGGFVFSREDGSIIDTQFPNDVAITSVPDLNLNNTWREILTANPDLTNTFGLESEDLLSPEKLRERRAAEAQTLPEGTIIPEGTILVDDVAVRGADGGTEIIAAGTRFDQAQVTIGENTIAGDFDDLKQAVIEVRITEAQQDILRETIERYEGIQQEVTMEQSREEFEIVQETVRETQADININPPEVNHTVRNADGEHEILDERAAMALGPNGDVHFTYSNVINDPVRVTETIRDGEVITQELVIEDGRIDISGLESGTFTLTFPKSESVFENQGFLASVDGADQATSALMFDTELTNNGGEYTLEYDKDMWPEGTQYLTFGGIPGGQALDIEPNRLYPMAHVNGQAVVLDDNGQPFPGDERSGVDATFAYAPLNLAQLDMGTITPEGVVGIEDNYPNRGTWTNSDIATDRQDQQFTMGLEGQGPDIVETNVERDPIVTARAIGGVGGFGDDFSLYAGGGLRVETQPIDENGNEKLFQAYAQADLVGIVRAEQEFTTRDITRGETVSDVEVTTTTETLQSGITTETLRNGEVINSVTELGDIEAVGDPVVTTRQVGEERTVITEQTSETSKDSGYGLGLGIRGEAGINVNPIVEQGEVFGNVNVNALATTFEGTEEANLEGSVGWMLGNDFSINAVVERELAGQERDTNITAEARYTFGGRGGQSHNAREVDTIEDLRTQLWDAQAAAEINAAYEQEADQISQKEGEDIADGTAVSPAQIEGVSNTASRGAATVR